MAYEGGCYCGSVRFRITGSIRNIVYCHCSRCRKANGSAFAANGIVRSLDFKILKGENSLTAYQSTPGKMKYFCRVCGSPIVRRNSVRPEEVQIRLGTIDSDIVERPMAHIFTTSKANWGTIEGDLPQYEGSEVDR